MKVEFVNPFVTAAYQVLEAEVGSSISKGNLHLEEAHYTTNDVTAVIGVVGKVSGTVLYGMSEPTANKIASVMMGQVIALFNDTAQSCISELGNMITGRASILLEEAGYPCKITPPTLLIGRGTIISTTPFQRLVIPLVTEQGEVTIAVALKETPNVETQAFAPSCLRKVE